MPIRVDLRKVPIHIQIQLRAPSPEKRERYLQELFESAPTNKDRALVCCAAYDMGFREFARRYSPKPAGVTINEVNQLILQARRLVGTSAPVELMTTFDSMPVRNDGVLYPRDGFVVRIDFSDSKRAYCKSRNPEQESVGIDLERIVGLPAYRYTLSSGWIITESVSGRTLFDHTFLSGGQEFDANANGQELFKRIIAITAFDYIFGLLDRNEGGILFGPDARVTAVDHEYLLIFTSLPLRGVSLVNLCLYLREMGLPSDLLASSLGSNLDYAAEVFETAGAKREEIVSRLTAHIAQSISVVLAFENHSISPQIIDEALRRIDAGVNGFCETLQGEIEQVRRLHLFE